MRFLSSDRLNKQSVFSPHSQWWKWKHHKRPVHLQNNLCSSHYLHVHIFRQENHVHHGCIYYISISHIFSISQPIPLHFTRNLPTSLVSTYYTNLASLSMAWNPVHKDHVVQESSKEIIIKIINKNSANSLKMYKTFPAKQDVLTQRNPCSHPTGYLGGVLKHFSQQLTTIHPRKREFRWNFLIL